MIMTYYLIIFKFNLTTNPTTPLFHIPLFLDLIPQTIIYGPKQFNYYPTHENE